MVIWEVFANQDETAWERGLVDTGNGGCRCWLDFGGGETSETKKVMSKFNHKTIH
jgi:hypothetical protein